MKFTLRFKIYDYLVHFCHMSYILTVQYCDSTVMSSTCLQSQINRNNQDNRSVYRPITTIVMTPVEVVY